MTINKVRNYFKDTPKKSKAYFKEYCEYSGIHGFRYIAEDRTYHEKIWWIISIGLSVLLCGIMIYQIIWKYLNYPIIVTFSMTAIPVYDIPFPAVTICPSAKISQDYFNITEAQIKQSESEGLDFETNKRLHMAEVICLTGRRLNPDRHPLATYMKNVTNNDLLDFLEMSKIDFIDKVLFNKGKIMYVKGDDKNGAPLFTPVLTQEGLCYSFNVLDRNNIYRDDISFSSRKFQQVEDKSQWNIEKGYETNTVYRQYRNGTIRYLYPFRAEKGYEYGLTVILITKTSDIVDECSDLDSGYWMKIHSPSQIPQTVDLSIKLPLNQHIIGQITPNLIKTSPDVEKFSFYTRKCYFQSERRLRYFKIYTQENCLLECRTNHTLRFCKCVEPYMPRSKDTPICSLGKANCTYAYEDIINSNLVGKCRCLPSCTDLNYNVELSYNPLTNVQKYKKHLDAGYQMSILQLYFSTSHIQTKERNVIYGFSDFVSNFGGLLGLFTGFSILSLIEIIYFLSLRIWGNVKLYKNWSGKSNENDNSIC